MSLDRLAYATLLVATWHRVAWAPLGRLTLADVLEVIFCVALIGSRVRRRDARLTRTTLISAAFVLALAATYLAGAVAVGIDTNAVQFAKGFTITQLHLVFLVALVAYLSRAGAGVYRRALGFFVAGFVLNAAYGAVQYAAQTLAGVNIDAYLITPFFPGSAASGLNVYGSVATLDQNGGLVQTSVLRAPGLTNDPNHLGVLLCIPIMIIAALAAWRWLSRPMLAGGLVAVLLLVVVLTQSRSALLGLAVGGAVLAASAGRRLLTAALAVPAVAAFVAVLAVAVTHLHFVLQVLQSRTDTSTSSFSLHTQVYGFIPELLSQHPLFGIGLNGFAQAFAWQTGRAGFGPHSAYVEILAETGLVGTILFCALVGWTLRRLWQRRSNPIAVGLAAAIIATLAANIFYLTIIFPSWPMLLALALALEDAEPLPAATQALAVDEAEPAAAAA